MFELRQTSVCRLWHLLGAIEIQPTADDEVWVEDAQGGLVGALLIVDGRWDDEAEGDARDALQHDEDDDQHQGAFIRHLQSQKWEEDRDGWVIKEGRGWRVFLHVCRTLMLHPAGWCLPVQEKRDYTRNTNGWSIFLTLSESENIILQSSLKRSSDKIKRHGDGGNGGETPRQTQSDAAHWSGAKSTTINQK